VTGADYGIVSIPDSGPADSGSTGAADGGDAGTMSPGADYGIPVLPTAACPR